MLSDVRFAARSRISEPTASSSAGSKKCGLQGRRLLVNQDGHYVTTSELIDT
jgi:hypothetical protein